MPNYPVHASLGGIIGGIIGYYFGFEGILIGLPILVGIIYGLLPDIDHQNSLIRWVVTTSVVCTSAVLQALVLFRGGGLDILKVSFIITMALAVVWLARVFGWLNIRGFGHRGVVHTLWAGLLFSSIFLFINQFYLGVVGFGGFMSHLLADKYFSKRSGGQKRMSILH